ncbi:MAG: isopenicillin N synthase family oxygenase [Deltaproteobacteria bacterium]|nr:isopenicillin N synthase family oxygenase [Deltaproteobacteria bacterium]
MSAGIPEVDFGPFLKGDAAARRRVADEVRTACGEYGFLNVANLPLPSELVQRVAAKAKEFFALPAEVKDAIGRSDLDVISGYVGVAVEHLDTQQPGDLKESFSLNQASLKLLDRWHIPVAGFRETVLELHEAAAHACAALVRAMALSLGAPEDFFEDKHAPHASTARFFHYPPLTRPPGDGQLRAGAHTDYGTVTLVFQDEVEGLEALVDGRWLTVPVVPGTVTVNVADLLSRWSNGIYRSPKHRVALPSANAEQSRYSNVFFYNPNSAATVRCLDSCCDAGRPARYPPIAAGEFLRQRRAAQYQ